MSLKVKHNRADHTHENEQFRRIAKSLKLLFDERKWNGLLIGNPYNENYSRFKADGILLYDHGLIIIDLKSYSGNIKLPKDKREFENSAWYTESDTDKQRILIKAGSRFINPFKQLNSYREAFKEIVDSEINLKDLINKTRTCALNIFSGPISLDNHIPKELPFYKLVQESDFGTLLYDYSSVNTYSEELADSLCQIFNASDWHEHVEMPIHRTIDERKIEINKDVEHAIDKFLKSDENGIFVLESMNFSDRDDWVEYILSKSQEYEVPQIETWIHSSRIAKKVSDRVGFELHSLYNTIYGGSSNKINLDKDPNEEDLQDVIPIRSDDTIDEAAVIILHEAHLVSRSLHQSDLLRFGTGRLLEDLLTFINLPETSRKLICIGDPYSLTYGKDSDSALDTDNLANLYNGLINHFRAALPSEDKNGKTKLRVNLANGIEENIFNELQYPWSNSDLEQVNKNEIPNLLIDWFSRPMESDPSQTVMVFSNKDARKINLWVKDKCLKNGKDISPNDLLLLCNNIRIPDETGFGQPAKLYNGMFLLVESVGETISQAIAIRQNNRSIILNFKKIRVKCLSLPSQLEAEVYMLENYFNSESDLSKDEQIAFRVFVNMKVNYLLKKESFESTQEYVQLQQDIDYKTGIENEVKLKKQIESGEKVKTKLQKQQIELRKIVRKYKRKLRVRLLSYISKHDPFVNAIHVKYGWSLTVHKCIGSSFTNSIINAYQGENQGVDNAGYFRWLYSALTATKNKARVVNPQLLNPLMELEIEDTAEAGKSKKSRSKPFLIYERYTPNEPFASIFPADLQSNIVGAICELSKLLEQQGIILDSVSPINDYLTKAHFSIPTSTENQFTLAVNNKGSKDRFAISSIRIENNNGGDSKIINSSIETLFSKKKQVDVSKKNLMLPADFRSPIYRRWIEILKENGYVLNFIESHNNQDVFWAENSKGDYIKFQVYYKNSGFFTKLFIIEKSDLEVSESLKKWLIDEY